MQGTVVFHWVKGKESLADLDLPCESQVVIGDQIQLLVHQSPACSSENGHWVGAEELSNEFV